MKALRLAGYLLSFALGCPAFGQGVPPNLSRVLGTQLPDVKFVDTQGRAFTLSELKGRPVILSPIYAGCPSACIVISRSVNKSLSRLNLSAETYTVLSFSFDPKETVADMKSFQQKHQLNARNWRIACVPDDEALFQLLDAIDFRFTYVSEQVKDHPNLLVFLDSEGVIRHYEFGLEFTPEQLARGLRIARGEYTLWERVSDWIFPIGALGVLTTGAWIMLTGRRRQ
ncbi:MAG: SCO family protein [Fimbriimonadales bacterium]|nr:MAG: SCO family protein [Fimbriimonadales bacterium]